MDVASTDHRMDSNPSDLSALIEQTEARAGADVSQWLLAAEEARVAGRPEVARTLLLKADGRFSNIRVRHALARLAEIQRDLTEAERWWRRSIELDDKASLAYTSLAENLRLQNRIDEAEALLDRLITLFPQDKKVFVHRAILAEGRRDWTAAVERWRETSERFPDTMDGHFGFGKALVSAGRIDEAEAVASRSIELFPGNPLPYDILGRVAEHKKDWATAEQHWRELIRLGKADWWSYVSLIRTLCLARRLPEAVQTYQVATGQFPHEAIISIEFVRALVDAEYLETVRDVVAGTLARHQNVSWAHMSHLARAAIKAGAWDAAVESIRRLNALSSNDGELVESGRLESALKVRLAETTVAGTGPVAKDTRVSMPMDAESLEQSRLLMRFESLGGDDAGSEIGLVQRHFHAEPIGLLRWANISAGELTQAVECGFEGVGTAGQTDVVLAPEGDYHALDARFSMSMLTFLKRTDFDLATAKARALTRIRFLRKKLLQDLAEGEKIFVYRTRLSPMPLDQVVALKAAMGRWGDNRLLYLKVADADNPVGSVSLIAPGLCFGYLEGFSDEPDSRLFLDGWLAVFRRAAELWPGRS